jgi:hypothetical protein
LLFTQNVLFAQGTPTLSGNNAFTGINTFPNINNVRYVDGVKFTTIAGALSDPGAKIVVVPDNYAGADSVPAANQILVDFRGGSLKIWGGTSGGTQSSRLLLFNSTVVNDSLALVQDNTFSTFFQRLATNTPTYISAVPTGSIPDGTARSLFRAYGTDIVADPINFESVDMESERVPATSPGGPLTVYYFAKTRIGGTGLHRPVLAQIGGINLLYMDPTLGCIVTAPKSVDTFGAAADFLTTGCGKGDLVLGVNGRALRTVNAAGNNTIPLISANNSNQVVLAANTSNPAIVQRSMIIQGSISTGSFTHSNTVPRTYTFPDANMSIFIGRGTLTYAAIPAQTCQERTFSLIGVLTTGIVTASPTSDIGSNLSYGGARVSASGTVAVRVCNPTAVALTPNPVSWNIQVAQ